MLAPRNHPSHPTFDPPDQKWLNMAVLDLLESKKAGAAALEEVNVLLEEKKILKEKLQINHDLWELEKKQLEESLMLTKRNHENNNFAQAYEIALLKVSVNSEKQDSLCFKLKLEGAVDEIDFLSSRLQVLGLQLKNKEAQFNDFYKSHVQKNASQEETLDNYQHVLDELKKGHQIEVQNLKNEQTHMSTKWKQEVSALIREKNFVWGQFKRMEDSYTSRLNKKKEELKTAELDLQRLQLRVVELEKAHDEKTVESTVLRISVQTVEEELSKLREELLHLKEAGQIDHNQGPKQDVRNDDQKVIVSQELKEAQNVEVSDVTLTLIEKQEQLKKAEKLVHELRRENENLRLLYADLEQQFKDKHKPGKPKDTTTRNLTAELEAVALTVNRASPKMRRGNNQVIPRNGTNVGQDDFENGESREIENRVQNASACPRVRNRSALSNKTNIQFPDDDDYRLVNSGIPKPKDLDSAMSLDHKRKRPKSCSKMSKKRETSTPVDGAFLKTNDSNIEIKSLERSEHASDKAQPQSNPNSIIAAKNIRKSRLFSSVFAIPKVLPT